MHWLISLDHALFHFGNSTLSNGFFDWLMPILSGEGVPWLPACILGLIAAVWFGSPRLKVCGVLMLLVVAIGDPLILAGVKDSAHRARPCVALPHVIERLSCGGYRSFPSAHAANWFAIATVACWFYRRSTWFMFPMAAAVAFSRVYCGVHFPIDITAGALLGAGYALVILFAAEKLWSALGQRWFPAWHSRLPSLLKTPEKLPPAKESDDGREWLHLGYLVIVVCLVARWLYIRSGAIELSGDEAYQWTWSKHLALSYFSKPAGIACLQKFGTWIGGDTDFGVRFCSPLLAAILGWLVLRFLAREADPRTAFWSLLATLAVPLLCVGSVLMTIDPPLVLCWVWATLAGWRALRPEATTRDWLWVGLAMGLGFLFKPMAAAQIACWAIFFALAADYRSQLKKPGPWLALAVIGICSLPVLIWNAQHGWVMLGHIGGNAGLDKKWEPTLRFFGEFIGAEVGLLNPVLFLAVLWASIAFWRRRREKPLWLYLACMGAPLFYGCWLWSLHSRVQPNQCVAAIVPMFCLGILYWRESTRAAKFILAGGFLIGIPMVLFLHSSSITKVIVGAKLPGDVDISHRLRGWKEAATTVEQVRQEFDPAAFVIADNYGDTGLLSIYSPPARQAVSTDQPLVYCVRGDRISSQFYLWDQYDYQKHRVGQNAIYVDHLEYYKLEKGWIGKWLHHQPLSYRDVPAPEAPPKFLTDGFESVTNLGIREIKLSDGRVFHRLQIFGCRGLKARAAAAP